MKHILSPSDPGNCWVSYAFAFFSECHINGIIHNTAFWNRLFSFSIMPLISISLITNGLADFSWAYLSSLHFLYWSIQTFCPSFKLGCCFLTVEFREVFIYSGCKFFIRKVIWKYFLLAYFLSFILFVVFFLEQRFLTLNAVITFFLSWFVPPFDPRTLSLIQTHKDFLPRLLLKVV